MVSVSSGRHRSPHQAPVVDVYAGLLWTAEHAEVIGVTPSAS